MLYEYLWRNKWLTSEAKSIGEMADCLEKAAQLLREMTKDGVILDNDDDDISDDYAYFVTDNLEVATKYDFDEINYEDDEDNDFL